MEPCTMERMRRWSPWGLITLDCDFCYSEGWSHIYITEYIIYLPSLVQHCCDCTNVDTFCGHLHVPCTLYMLAQAHCDTFHTRVGLTEAFPAIPGLCSPMNPNFCLQTRWIAFRTFHSIHWVSNCCTTKSHTMEWLGRESTWALS